MSRRSALTVASLYRDFIDLSGQLEALEQRQIAAAQAARAAHPPQPEHLHFINCDTRVRRPMTLGELRDKNDRAKRLGDDGEGGMWARYISDLEEHVGKCHAIDKQCGVTALDAECDGLLERRNVIIGKIVKAAVGDVHDVLLKLQMVERLATEAGCSLRDRAEKGNIEARIIVGLIGHIQTGMTGPAALASAAGTIVADEQVPA